MKSFLPTAFVLFLLCNGCVSSKVFNALETDYAVLKGKYVNLEDQRNALEKERDTLQNRLAITADSLQSTQKELVLRKEMLAFLRADYEMLEKSSDSTMRKQIAENRALLDSIDQKEIMLETRLEQVNELKQLIQSQEEAMEDLKESLSDALLNFEGRGLRVEHRNGKVYVSMENKLLFKSGQWKVAKEGREALKKLSGVLAENPDVSVLIEGHTDNDPYTEKGNLNGNWDLSTKRATAVVNILLENPEILPQNLIAAGRSEFVPIAPNTTPEGKAANRRIEVILTPEWDEIRNMLNDY